MIELRDFCDLLDKIEINPVRIHPANEFGSGTVPSDGVVVGCLDKMASTIPTSVLVLDNKGSDKRFNIRESYGSVLRMVTEQHQPLLDSWLKLNARQLPVLPQDFFNTTNLMVDDASPDSTWGLLLFLARLAGLPESAIKNFLPPWLASIELWEEEGGMAADPWSEWPALASALAHSHFPVGRESVAEDYAKAWSDTLRFAAGCIARNFSPVSIPKCPDWSVWRAAEAALRQEEQAYKDWLPHALIVQLSVPLRHAQRRLLVDALLIIEDQPTGSAKIFYRNDRVNSPLKDGFTLAAHYRPGSQPGGGNDITIAIDTRKGIYLRELWERLEELECRAWEERVKNDGGPSRPRDRPRELKLKNVEDRWNQPWYLDWKTESIIGAPYSVLIGQKSEPGSLLTWEQVKQALWEVYNPLKGIEVRTLNGEPCLLLKLPPEEADTEAEKRLLLARWPEASTTVRRTTPRSLGDAPIVDRVFAAMIDRASPREPITVDALTQPAGFEKIKLPGGFAIVTQNGLFALDDWHPIPRIDLTEIKNTFHRAVKLDQELNDLQAEIKALADLLRSDVEKLTGPRSANQPTDSRFATFIKRHPKPKMWLDRYPKLAARLNRTPAWRESTGLITRAAESAVRLAKARAEAVVISPAPDVRAVADAIDRRWALGACLNALEEQTKTIRDSTRELGDAHVRRIVQFAALYGFPFYVSNDLAGPSASLITGLCLRNASDKRPPFWLWWVCFGTLLFISLIALRILFRLHDNGQKEALEKGPETIKPKKASQRLRDYLCDQ